MLRINARLCIKTRDHDYTENYATYNDFFRTDFALVKLVKLQHTHIHFFWDDIIHRSGHHNHYNFRHLTNIYMSSFT